MAIKHSDRHTALMICFQDGFGDRDLAFAGDGGRHRLTPRSLISLASYIRWPGCGCKT
jgi:hypothetical protein